MGWVIVFWHGQYITCICFLNISILSSYPNSIVIRRVSVYCQRFPEKCVNDEWTSKSASCTHCYHIVHFARHCKIMAQELLSWIITHYICLRHKNFQVHSFSITNISTHLTCKNIIPPYNSCHKVQLLCRKMIVWGKWVGFLYTGNYAIAWRGFMIYIAYTWPCPTVRSDWEQHHHQFPIPDKRWKTLSQWDQSGKTKL